MSVARALVGLVVLLALAHCRHASDPAGVPHEGATTTTSNANPSTSPGVGDAGQHVSFAPARTEIATHARAPSRTARASETLTIPAGAYHLGSTPGDHGRDPSNEADGTTINVPAFDIDALPYPNDPAQPARLGATRDEAAALCRDRGRRLCTEIEWERACRGPQETLFPGSDAWDAERCGGRGDPGLCASGYGALVMGARDAEWTSDDLDQRAVIRGAGSTALDRLHRCASRRTAVANQSGLEIAFRCCGGPAPQLAYPREQSQPMFREEPMGIAQLAQIVAEIPELARVRDGLAIFSPSAITEVLNHGATTAEQHPEVHFTVSPVRWSPTFGEDVLVFAASSNAGSFVAALWVLPPLDGHTPRYRHASSFILAGDRISMTLAYSNTAREEIQWSACWNCGGEHGVVHYDRDEARVIAVQR